MQIIFIAVPSNMAAVQNLYYDDEADDSKVVLNSLSIVKDLKFVYLNCEVKHKA